jgi:hypothetical protein
MPRSQTWTNWSTTSFGTREDVEATGRRVDREFDAWRHQLRRA